MTTITITLPPKVSAIVDAIGVSVLDDTRDRQPRHTFLEGVKIDEDRTTLTFTTS